MLPLTFASVAVTDPGSMFAVFFPGVEQSSALQPPVARLPVELLLQCLLAADHVTRIRASHVCTIWRDAALSERRLWDGFACSRFCSKQHEDAMLSMLEAMLLRSHPLPFHLTVPHLDGRPDRDYTDRLLAVKELDVFRLAAYHGPTRLFRLLNPTCAPLPNLHCLDVLRFPSDGDPDITTIDLTGQFAARVLLNLQRLAAPNVRFPADGAPFGALRSITLEGIYGHHHRALFTYCPSLTRVNITESARGTPLPEPPVPPTLEEVFIGCSPPRELDLLALMHHWRGVCIPRLVARQVYSLEGLLSLFLSSHERPIELRFVEDDDQTVVLSTIPEDKSVWTLSPALDWADYFLAGIEKPTSNRLTSLCIAFARLGALLAAQLEAPGLENLELRVDSASGTDPPLLHAGEEHFLRAPRLRSVSFNLGADCPDWLEDAFGVLRTSFRTLFIYDAELLDTITVSTRSEHACAGFAQFAKDYVLTAP